MLDKALPSPIENASLRTLLRPNYRGFVSSLAALPLRVAATVRRLAGNIGEISMVDVVMGLAEGLPTGVYHNRGIEQYVAQRALRPRPHQRLPRARRRALHHRHRSRHLRADRLRRGGVGQRADLPRRRGLRRAADRLRALRAPRQAARRRRDHLDHQRRRRGGGGRQVHRRRQPAGPVRERLRDPDPDRLRLAGAPRLRHGHARDRQPGLPAAGSRASAPRGRSPGTSASRTSTSS